MRIAPPGPLLAAILTIWFSCFVFPCESSAQESSPTTQRPVEPATGKPAARTMSKRFIPPDALMVVDIQPAAVLTSDQARFLPTEVIEVWCEQNVGLQPVDIAFIRIMSPMPAGPGAPSFGGVIAFASGVDISQLKDGLIDRDSRIEVEGKTCYRFADGAPAYLMPVSEKLWLVGTEDYLPKVLAASSADGPMGVLADIVETIPMRGHVQVAVDLEPLKPLMHMGLASKAREIPPTMARLPELINHVDAFWTTADLTTLDWMSYGKMVIRSPTPESADQVEQILEETIENVRADLVAQAMQSFNESTPMNDAWQKYIQRVSTEVTPLLKLRREGRLFMAPEFEDMQAIGVTGIAVGLLLPAVQAAREAARRMSASNHLKQIGLAMHNHHSAYRNLPKASSTDDNGEPLLSWRVAILPFIEQQALYERFHLDEPWDSEHNLALLDEMPSVFEDPSVQLAPGMTLFHAPVGSGMIYSEGTAQPRFRDILDGLSNTIMVYEGSKASAVPWTKPVEENTDLANPLSTVGDTHPGGFHVLMGDGAVRFITLSIDQTILKNLLTSAGGETINDF